MLNGSAADRGRGGALGRARRGARTVFRRFLRPISHRRKRSKKERRALESVYRRAVQQLVRTRRFIRELRSRIEPKLVVRNGRLDRSRRTFTSARTELGALCEGRRILVEREVEFRRRQQEYRWQRPILGRWHPVRSYRCDRHASRV